MIHICPSPPYHPFTLTIPPSIDDSCPNFPIPLGRGVIHTISYLEGENVSFRVYLRYEKREMGQLSLVGKDTYKGGGHF